MKPSGNSLSVLPYKKLIRLDLNAHVVYRYVGQSIFFVRKFKISRTDLKNVAYSYIDSINHKNRTLAIA